MPKVKEQPADVVPSFPETLPALRFDPNQFKAVRKITRDVNSMTRLGQAIICCQSELYAIEMDDPGKKGEKRPVPAVDVLDCLRGEEIVLICGSVLASALKREGTPLVGRYFAVQSGEIVPGKRYRKVDVVALERTE